MINEILVPLIEKCFSKALHIRHGAILGVSEILVGLSGHSAKRKQETLEKAFVSLSINQRKIIKDSENQAKFRKYYEELSTKNYLPEFMPQESENMKSVRDIIQRIEKERLYRGKGGEVVRGSVCHLINALSTA